MAFDFGLKRIGVAVGETVTKTARPLQTLPAKKGVPDWALIQQLIKRFEPSALIVGIPLKMNGATLSVTRAARAFKAALMAHCAIPVYETDERLTTKAARDRIFQAGGYRALQEKTIDAYAAQLILEHWFATILR